ncbi:MAG TPA: hypothetical protein PKY35_01025 [Candidatus Hydrogenedentes bacterium]|nr:hypothetical protein [Candidatus Hydrogenedentota bacterium]HOL75584.1 hypothetical protein [Candidatus Hydrogenedentota bacterium]HPO86992.1 hypothetical protein [Candidatus Hydrogenedentota bacterium]
MRHIKRVTCQKPSLGATDTTPNVPSITGLIEVITSFFNAFILLIRFKAETQTSS